MMKKLIKIIFFLSISVFVKAQTFDLLPEDTNPYEGGSVQFYKDLNDVLVKNNFKPCSNRPSEMFLADIEIVNGDGKIVNKKFNDDCVTKLFLNAFQEVNKLKKWNDSSGKQRKFSIIFYPIDYFSIFKEGYTTEGLKKEAHFPGGIEEFKKQLGNNLKNQKIKNAVGLKVMIRFKVNQEGIINNIHVESGELDSSEKEKIVRAIEKIDKKWNPETFREQPLISTYQLSLSL
ncbi:hypothetical protein HHL23_02820 [Chryseobacterium sp. RP-3-3]|uniref:TonB C-terminal domain-containing protein n=1 Tax=Chryseobacterium antibioticum TaxID=2728847 RepID=A0A7Y0FQJ6_9FLAO|nr:hypothetical protein [Chryseobacterium antibioticum]NML68730.1 hypothetical protein [Chryseobacterium antibioticum]